MDNHIELSAATIVTGEVTSLVVPNASTEQARAAADDLTKLKKLLEAAGLYKEKATEYIRLEAQTWVDITAICARSWVDVLEEGEPGEPDYYREEKTKYDFDGEFTYTQKKVMKFILSTGDHANQLPQECADSGSRITSYANRWDKEQRAAEELKTAEEYVELTVDEFGEKGRTSINRFDRLRFKHISPATVDAIKNRTKDRLLRRGAVGIGNGEYVAPTKCDRKELEDSLNLRLRSIVSDINSFDSILSKLPNDATDYMKYSGAGLAMMVVPRFLLSNQRVKERMSHEFRLMVEGKGIYNFNCTSTYVHLKEAFDEILENDYQELKDKYDPYGGFVRNKELREAILGPNE